MIDPASLAAYAGAGDALGSLVGSLFGDSDRERALRELRNLQPEIAGMGPEDQNLKARQMEALQKMYEMSQAGGMDPQSRAALQQAQAATAAAERGSRGAIVQNAQARGVGGSGVEFGAALANQQGAATRNSMAGTQAAGDARTRALQAMQGSQQGYGQVRGQDLNAEQARKQIEMFNAEQRRRKAEAMAGVYSAKAQQTASMGGGLGSAAGGLYSALK